jgi:putative transposase
MKRHSPNEIRAKLRQADELSQQGLSQPDICKALGISVMTLHRWRKDPDVQRAEPPPAADPGAMGAAGEADALVLENRRLRKIVADLLLEKATLEEALTQRAPKPGRPKS